MSNSPSFRHQVRRFRFAQMTTATLGAAILIMASERAHAQSVPFDTMIDLGTLGGRLSSASAVNHDGTVIVGTSGGNTPERAFRWTEAGGMQDLGTLGGPHSLATDVNGDGIVVVGYSMIGAQDQFHAFRWTPASGMVDLGTLGGPGSRAFAVSDDGNTVAGQSFTSEVIGQAPNFTEFAQHAFRWTATNGMIDLGTLGGRSSFFGALSGDGSTVVGNADLRTENQSHAFRWNETTGMVDLGTLGGVSSHAVAVSEHGDTVAGFSLTRDNTETHAFVWNVSSRMIDLGTLGGPNSSAAAISRDGGTLVGTASTATGAEHAFRWTQAGGITDLGALSGGHSKAASVSDDGRVVVGSALTSPFIEHAFRWTEASGMQDLGTLGGSMSSAHRVSGDGSVVIGTSEIEVGDSTTHVFIYRTKMQDLTNIVESLDRLARDTEVATEHQRDTLSWLLNDGCAVDEGDRTCIGASGLWTLARRVPSSTINKHSNFAATIDAGFRISSRLTIGARFAVFDSNAQGGVISPHTGYAVGGRIEYAPDEDNLRGLKASIAVGRASQGNRIERGKGLPSVDVAPAHADLETTSVRGQIGYGVDIGRGIVVTPLAGVTWQRSEWDAYQESLGEFPASFEKSRIDTAYATAGAEFMIPAGANRELTVGGRLDLDLATDPATLVSTSGIPGMEAFAVRSQLKRHDLRGRFIAGFVEKSRRGNISINAEVATPTLGSQARFSLGMRFDVGF